MTGSAQNAGPFNELSENLPKYESALLGQVVTKRSLRGMRFTA
jgi:hypothetical protein